VVQIRTKCIGCSFKCIPKFGVSSIVNAPNKQQKSEVRFKQPIRDL
jgi:hypothetical protein